MVEYIKLGDYVLTRLGTGRVTELEFDHLSNHIKAGEVYDPLGETSVTIELANGEVVIFGNAHLLANLQEEQPRGELVMHVACDKD